MSRPNPAPVTSLPIPATPEASDGINDEAWPQALNDAAYHGLAGDVVRTIGPHSEADPAALLTQFLVFVGSCIGRDPHYQVEGDRHYTNLFVVLVGKSSKARKGTSQGRMRQLIRKVDEAFDRECICSGLSSGEGLIWEVRDEMGDDPGVSDKRRLVAESEYAGLLRVMVRDGNIVSRIVRDAWDRGDIGTMTKKNPVRATDAHISIVGHVTDEELRRYLDRTECANGFANRFLFVSVKRSKYLPYGGDLKDSDLNPLAQRLAKAIGFAKNVARVTMDEPAAGLWGRIYEELSEGQPGLYGAVTGRAEAQVIRLALIYALLDEQNRIGVSHLRAALAVWEYCDASAKYVFGAATGDPVADSIMRALRENPNGLTRTGISGALGRHYLASRIDAALEMLKSAGRVECQKDEATGGRPSETWLAK